MKITVVLLSLLMLVACDSKKSSKKSMGQVTPVTEMELKTNSIAGTTSTPGVVNPEVSTTDKLPDVRTAGPVTEVNKDACEEMNRGLEDVPSDWSAIDAGELATGEKSNLELSSVEAILSVRGEGVKLVEKRLGKRYFQNCKNLAGLGDFELRYAAPRYIGLKDGNIGKSGDSKGEVQRFRLSYKASEGKAKAFISKAKIKGTVAELTSALVDLAGSDVRIFRLPNGDVEIRTSKDIEGNLTLVTGMRFELKKKK